MDCLRPPRERRSVFPKVFFLYTCGQEPGICETSIRETAEARGCTVPGKYSCKGFDTFGPLKLPGELNKNHLVADEIRKSVEFYGDISKKTVISGTYGAKIPLRHLNNNLSKNKTNIDTAE